MPITESTALQTLQLYPSLSPDRQVKAKASLFEYDAQQKAAGLSRFPELDRQYREKQATTRKAFQLENFGLDDEKLEQFNAIHEADDDSKYRAINTMFLAGRNGRKEEDLTQDYEALRDQHSEKQFGKKGMGEKEFYESVKTQFDTQDTIGLVAQEAAFKGQSAAESLALFEAENELPPLQRQEFRGDFIRSFNYARRKIEPHRKLVSDIVEDLKAEYGLETETGENKTFANIAERLLEVPSEDLDFVFSAMMATAGEGEVKEGFINFVFQRFGENVARGGRDISFGALGTFTRANLFNVKFGIKMADTIPEGSTLMQDVLDSRNDRIAHAMDTGGGGGSAMSSSLRRGLSDGKRVAVTDEMRDEATAEVDKALSFLAIHDRIRKIGDSGIDPSVSSNMVAQGLLDAGRSLPYMAASVAGPAGFIAVSASLGDETYHRLLHDNPGMSPDDANAISLVFAPIQGGLERLGTRAVMGKVPALNRLTNAVISKSSSVLIRGSLRVGGLTILEMAQEDAQDLSPLVGQEILAAIKEDVPDVDWDTRWGELAEGQLKLFWAVLPLSLVGGGKATWSDFTNSKKLFENPAAIQAVGISAESSTEIARLYGAGDNVAAEKLLRSEMKKGGQDQTAVQQHRARFLETIEKESTKQSSAIEILEKAGRIPAMIRLDGKYSIIFESGAKSDFDTHDEANTALFEHVAEQKLNIGESMRAVMGQLTRDLEEGRGFEYDIDFGTMDSKRVTDEGTMVGGKLVQPNREAMQDRSDVSGAIQTEGKKVPVNNESEFDVDAEFSEINASADLGGVDQDVKQIILGAGVNQFKHGVQMTSSKLFLGGNEGDAIATPLTVIEEKVEGDVKEMIRIGKKDWLVSAMREVEKAGKFTLFRDVADDSQLKDIDVIEGFSHLAQSYFVGRSRKGKGDLFGGEISIEGGESTSFRELARAILGTKAGAMLDSFSEFFRAVWRRAAKLNKLRREGGLDSELEFALAKSLGLSEQVEFERQIEEEAMQYHGELAESTHEVTHDAPFSMVPVNSEQDTAYLAAVESGDMTAVQAMVDAAAKAAGYLVSLFHGTTHKFNVFNGQETGSRSAWLGRTNYLTTSKSDASANYTGRGTDLAHRIGTLSQSTEIDLEEFSDVDIEGLYSDYNLDYPDPEGPDNVDLSLLADAIAKKTLRGGNPKVLSVFGKFDNTFEIDTFNSSGTIINAEGNSNWFKDALSRSLISNESDKLIEEVSEGLRQAKNGSDLFEAFTESDLIMEPKSDDGGFIVGEFINSFITELGYDSIVFKNADKEFKYAAEMDAETDHWHTLEPNRLKLSDPVTYDAAGNVIPLSKRFDQSRDEISFSAITQKQDTAYLAAVESGDMTAVQAMVDAAAGARGYGSKKWYHGTWSLTNEGSESFVPNRNFAKDRRKEGAPSLLGTWLTHSKRSAGAAYGPIVLSLYAKNENPFEFKGGYEELARSLNTIYSNSVDDMRSDLIERGYDSIYLPKQELDGSQQEVLIAFDPNQIKSADPVTYDEAGNVIPLSKRFDQSRDEISFSAITQKQDAAHLAAVESGDTETAQKMVNEAAMAAGHEIDHFIGGVIPSEPRLPVFTTTDREGAGWYAGERGEGGKIYNIAIKPGKRFRLDSEKDAKRLSDILTSIGVEHTFTPSSPDKGWYFESPEIAEHSAYQGDNPLDVAYIPEVRKELGRLGYGSIGASDALENGEIPVTVLIKSPSQIKSADPVTYDENGNVIPLSQRFDQSRDEISFSAITQKQDTTYLAAVESGDMTAVQAMVNEAAKAAGGSKRLYRGDSEPFEVFDKSKRGESTGARGASKAFWLTESEEDATGFARKAAWSKRGDTDGVTREFFLFGESVEKSGVHPNSTEAFEGVDRDTISYVKFKGIRDTTDVNLSLDISVNGERVFIDPRGALDEIVEEFGVVKDGKVTDPGMLAAEMEDIIQEEMEMSGTSMEETKENYPEMFKILEAAESGQEITIWNPPNVTVYAALNPSQIKSADPVTRDADGNVIPLSKRFDQSKDEISFSVITDQRFLRDQPKFQELQVDGRLETGVDLNDFTGTNIVLHSPDNAFAGSVSFGDEKVEGKGGVYYPLVFADENYFWASTKNAAKGMAKLLNENSRKNGGRTVMGLVSAPVEKLFSSTTMSNGAVTFVEALAKESKKSGITKSKLNSILAKASKAKAIVGNKPKYFSSTLLAKDSLEDNLKKIRGLLQPDASIFAVRKAFVESVATQISETVKGREDQSAYIAKILAGDDNKHAKSAIRKGKLSKAAIMQGLGNLFTEPFLKDFQTYGNGKVYAVLEVDGEVEAVLSNLHDSYPFAIAPKDSSNKVKVNVLGEAYDWQEVIGKGVDEKTTKEERKKLFPTSGISGSGLVVMSTPSEIEGDAVSFSAIDGPQLGADLETRLSAAFNPFHRSPELRAQLVAAMKAKTTEFSRKWAPVIAKARTKKAIGEERQKTESDLFNEKFGNLDENTQAASEIPHEQTTYEGYETLKHLVERDSGGKLKGRLQSESAAKKAKRNTLAEYDDIPLLPRVFYGGTLAPDQAAQEAGFDSIPEFWNAVETELAAMNARIEELKDADSEIKRIRAEAKDEAKVIADQQVKDASRIDRDLLLGGLRTLGAIHSTLPPEVRGRLASGFIQIAELKGPNALVNELEKRIGMIDGKLESWLKKEADKNAKKLFEKAKPAKDEAGKKRKGKAGADVHRLFDHLRTVWKKWDADEAEAHAVGVESKIAKGELSPEMEAHKSLEANLTRLFGGWKDADAATRTAAVESAKSVWEDGYLEYQRLKQIEKERRDGLRIEAINDSGNSGSEAQRRKRIKKENGITGILDKFTLNLLNFEQVAKMAFGNDSRLAKWFGDWERKASNQKEDAIQSKLESIEDLFTEMAGGRLKGEKLHFAMTQQSFEVEGIEMSELEGISVLMIWNQEDGKRHMEGRFDEDGKQTSSWAYDEEFVREVESNLSDSAWNVIKFLQDQYGSEHAEISPLYRKLNGIDLAENANYSPLTVKPLQGVSLEAADPFTGAPLNQGGTPSSLRARSASAVAEPDFRDALQTFVAHTKQIEHWKAYAEFLQDARGVLGNREVSNSVEGKSGKEAKTVISSWIDFFDTGGNRDMSAHLAISQGISKATGRAASMAIVGRIGTIAIQVTQLGAAAAKMPMGAYISRLGKLLSGNLSWRESFKSPYIQRRLNEMPPIVRQALEGLKSEKPNEIKYAVRKLGRLISGADALWTAGTYSMVYDYQLKEARKMGLEGSEVEAHARREAESVVDDIAQPTRAGARSIFENRSTNAFARLGMAFASEARKNLGVVSFALRGEKNAVAVGRSLLYMLVFNGLMSSVIRSGWRDMRDDDDEEVFDEQFWNPRRLLLSSLTEGLYGLPLFGELAQDTILKTAGEYVPEGNLLSQVKTSPQALIRLFEGDGDIDKNLRDLESVITAMGMTNDSVAAAASLMHIVRDVAGVTKNILD